MKHLYKIEWYDRTINVNKPKLHQYTTVQCSSIQQAIAEVCKCFGIEEEDISVIIKLDY